MFAAFAPRISFYVVAPRSHIEAGALSRQKDLASIGAKVRRRVAAYEGERDEWYSAWFEPTLASIEVGVISWEELVAAIGRHDPAFGGSLDAFYRQCLRIGEA